MHTPLPPLDPTLPGATLRDCYAARTQTPPRVDKPPRARKVVSFNENVHVVTYSCETSSAHSSNPDVSPDQLPDKPPRKRGRGVFRLLQRVAAAGEPEPAGCFSGQYDACCGLLNNAPDSACQDASARLQITESRLLAYQAPNDTLEQQPEPDRLSYTAKSRKLAKSSQISHSHPDSDAIDDDFDYTERNNTPQQSIHHSHPHLSVQPEPSAQHCNPETQAQRANSSFDITPLWQRLKRVDELDDIDHSRRAYLHHADIHEDEDVTPLPQPTVHLKLSHESRESTVSRSRRNRPAQNASSRNSSSATKSENSHSRLPPPVQKAETDQALSLSSTKLDHQSIDPQFSDSSSTDVSKSNSLRSGSDSVDEPIAMPFKRSVSSSKPPLPRSKSSAAESEPSYTALRAVFAKSPSLPASSSTHVRASTQRAVSEDHSDLTSMSPRKAPPTKLADEAPGAKKPPLPNGKTSKLVEEKKSGLQPVVYADNSATPFATESISGSPSLPVPQMAAKSRSTFERGSQTAGNVSKRIRSEEIGHDISVKPDSFASLSSPLTPDSKTEKSFSFKSFHSVQKAFSNPSVASHHPCEAQEEMHSRVSSGFHQSDTGPRASTRTPTESDDEHGLTMQNDHGRYGDASSSVPRGSGGPDEIAPSARQSRAVLSDIQSSRTEERAVAGIDSRVGPPLGQRRASSGADATLPSHSAAPSTSGHKGVPTVVDPNAAELVALSPRAFRRHSNKISASLKYTYEDDEPLTFSALNEADQLVDEPRSKLTIPKVSSGIPSRSYDGDSEDMNIFEAANRAAADISALVADAEDGRSAVGSLDELDLEPAVLPGEDDYSVAPMSPVQDYMPVAGIYYGNPSATENQVSSDDSTTDKGGIAEYPEYEVLRVEENDNDSVFESEPNTPVPEESSGWRNAQPKRSRDLSEHMRGSVSVQLANLSSIHGGRGVEDRTTGKIVPEVLLHDWSGNMPIEPTVEVVDSAPNSQSSESPVFRMGKVQRKLRKNSERTERTSNSTADVQLTLEEAKNRLMQDVVQNSMDEYPLQDSEQPNAEREDGRFSRPSSREREVDSVNNNNEDTSIRIRFSSSAGNRRSSAAIERGGNTKERTGSPHFQAALPKAFAADPKLQDFQMPLERKSLSEAGYWRPGVGGQASSFFEDEESDNEHERGARREYIGFKSSKHDTRPIQLPSQRRQVSDMEHALSLTRTENHAFRGVMGRLVSGVQIAKRMLSTN